MARLGINLDVWDEAETDLPVEEEITDSGILDIARGLENLNRIPDEESDEDDVTVVRVETERKTPVEQLTFWRSAATRMQVYIPLR